MRNIAIITGVTGDIGKEIAQTLVCDGYHVLGIGRDAHKGALLAQEIGKSHFSFFSLDISDQESVANFFDIDEIHTNKLCCLVTCAGILDICDISEIDANNWKQTLDINLTGTFLFFRSAIQKIKQTGNQATLYAIGSRWGNSGHQGAAAYSASKSALRAFIKSIQYDLIGSSIRAMIISPGSVAGKMSSHVDQKNTEKYINPREIGKLISYINSTDTNVLFDEIFIKAYPYDYKS